MADVRGHLALRRKQRQLRERLPIGIEDLDGFGPSRLLAVMNFSKIEDRSLHPLASRRADLFCDTRVVMILPVFETVVRVQKWLAHHRCWAAYQRYALARAGWEEG
ncbi:MAG: hypothetical protein JXQ71_17180 [Verrucomicrobia bacterium]|nr:hypothetical protein [Verrucomicrobiota bacterium]